MSRPELEKPFPSSLVSIPPPSPAGSDTPSPTRTATLGPDAHTAQDVGRGTGGDRPNATTEKEAFPEGGAIAWRVVAGSWLTLFGSMGLMNSLGALQAYIASHQLASADAAAVAWIPGLYCGVAFFGGVWVGPVFDARRSPRRLVAAGGAGTVAFLLLLGVCTEYWHFVLVFGLLGGASLALVFGPAVALVAHYFDRRRGLATGLASSGSSAGGVVFPLVLDRLYRSVGFAAATRIAALICLVAFSAALLLLRPRFPPKPLSMKTALPDLAILRSPPLLWTAFGVFFMEWGLFVPISYLTSYALDHGLTSSFSYLLVALINGAAIPGRWLPGYLSDKFGRFNVLIITNFACGLSVAALWLPSGSSVPMLAAYAVVFGFFSGSTLSLAPVCLGQQCTIESYGRYYATANLLVSISTLTSIPIAGRILAQSHEIFQILIIFTAASYMASFVCLTFAKIARCGSRGLWAIF